MGSLGGYLQRPFLAASAVAVASVYTDLFEKLKPSKLLDIGSSSDHQTSTSHLIRVPVPNIRRPVHLTSQGPLTISLFSSVVSSPVLLNIYNSAQLAKAKPTAYTCDLSIPSSSSDALYKWHLPEPNVIDKFGKSDCLLARSRTVVVLLGWLGAKQKHLRKYAEYYTTRGFNVITFTFPMSEIVGYKAGGKAEEHVDFLVNHLSDCLEDELEKNLVFHTFSNTGWLTYGVILEKFQEMDYTLRGRIKGCIVDSAPVASPHPQVWASGFSAAFLKKQSAVTKEGKTTEVPGRTNVSGEAKPAFKEAALHVILEKVFEVVLRLPPVNGKLTFLMDKMKSGQPRCPQLYIYSSADKVIPAEFVESFIAEQKRIGHQVRACNFISTPHVDHMRNCPELYKTQLTEFLEDCVLTSCKQDPRH
ncbi:transmembrane protein 53 [Heracleum sosnowskyi]|uniref:Transmembrane protein 53 n=1 Tax=Heracleum sosnowskyi TaxID=360622 RepID=A0AAD8ILM1_9APIA|nr:transmembrane protein 53 [Heracleum sosnowskyi]